MPTKPTLPNNIWNEKFTALKAWKKLNPDKWPSARSLNPDEKKLGIFCQDAKRRIALDNMPTDRLKKLIKINFHVNGYNDKWNEKYEKGKAYIKLNGGLITKDQYMYHWLWKNAVSNFDKLTKEQKKKIKSLKLTFAK